MAQLQQGVGIAKEGHNLPYHHRIDVMNYVCFFFFLAMPCGIWDLSSPTRDLTPVPCSGSTES